MSTLVSRVDTFESARALAARLNCTTRTRPVVVVTIPAGRDVPYIDAAVIQEELGDLAEVFLLHTGAVSWAFSHEMAEMTQVYGGAGRVYPVGVDWVGDPHRSPLRFAFNEREGRRSTRELITDALGMAAAAGLVGRAGPAPGRTAAGTVGPLVAGRAIVQLDGGRPASVVGELTVPGVPVERIVTAGLRVTGALDGAGRLDIRSMLRPATELPYRTGQVVLARVEEVHAEYARLALHPSLTVEVSRDAVTTNDLDDLDALMTPGEVLRVRVVGVAPWAVVLHDLEDHEDAVPAVALLDGGPPWIVEGLPEAEPDEEAAAPGPPPSRPAPPEPPRPPAPEPAPRKPTVTPAMLDRNRRIPAPAPTPAPTPEHPAGSPAAPAQSPAPDLGRLRSELARAGDDLARARAEIEGLRRERALVVDDRLKARDRVRQLEDDLARAKKKLRVTRTRTAADVGPWFIDDAEQFRYEVHAAWVRRIPAGQKSELPLAEYTLGPEFLGSVRAVHGIARAKVIDVVVEVLTGLGLHRAGREVHPLRTSESGGTAPRTRDDGAVCWRVSLQVNTPSARRLHYWKLPNRSIELSRVVVHDDFAP